MTLTAAQTKSATDPQTEAKVPTVRVKLVQAVKLDPRRSTMVKMRLTPHDADETSVVESATQTSRAKRDSWLTALS